jgi:hypothetical protein
MQKRFEEFFYLPYLETIVEAYKMLKIKKFKCPHLSYLIIAIELRNYMNRIPPNVNYIIQVNFFISAEATIFSININ